LHSEINNVLNIKLSQDSKFQSNQKIYENLSSI